MRAGFPTLLSVLFAMAAFDAHGEAPQASVNPDAAGTKPGFRRGYGYFWWLGEKQVDGRSYSFSFASGNGGNVVIVVPKEHLVVSLTSSAYGQGYGHQRAHNIFALVLQALR